MTKTFFGSSRAIGAIGEGATAATTGNAADAAGVGTGTVVGGDAGDAVGSVLTIGSAATFAAQVLDWMWPGIRGECGSSAFEGGAVEAMDDVSTTGSTFATVGAVSSPG